MEREAFLSGYCRQMDTCRMVEVLLVDGEIEEADCCYGNCVYQAACIIAEKIRELTEE